MTNKNFTTNIRTIKSITLASLLILAATMSTATLPVNGDSVKSSNTSQLPDSAYPAHMPAIAKQVQSYVNDQVAQHKGWVAHVSWNETSATVTYLGPDSTDPSNVSPSKISSIGGNPFPPLKSSGSVSPLTYFEGLKEGDGITKDCTSSSTAEFEVYDFYNIVKSTNTAVDNYQILNAMNSDNSRWLQVGTVFNETGDQTWKVVTNSWKTSTATNEFKKVNTISLSNGNQVESFIQDDPFHAGQYVLGISQQVSPFNSVSTTVSVSGDTGFKINLGQVSNGAGTFPSAGMVEQKTTSSGVGYNFGSETYNPYDFIDSFGGTATSCANGWVGQVGSGAHVSSTSNNPAQDTFAYG